METKNKPRPGDIFRIAPVDTSEPSPGIKANWKDKKTVIDPNGVFVLVSGKEITLYEFLRIISNSTNGTCK